MASVMSKLLATPWTATCQASLSMGFSRQEHWSGLPWHPPGDLPDPRDQDCVSHSSCTAGRFFITASPGKPNSSFTPQLNHYFLPWHLVGTQCCSTPEALLTLYSMVIVLSGVPFLQPNRVGYPWRKWIRHGFLDIKEAIWGLNYSVI